MKKVIILIVILLTIIFVILPISFLIYEGNVYNNPYPDTQYKRCGSTGLKSGEVCTVKINEPFVFSEAKTDINPNCYWRNIFRWHPLYKNPAGGFYIDNISFDTIAFNAEKFILTYNCELHHYKKFTPQKTGNYIIKTKGSHELEYNIIVE